MGEAKMEFEAAMTTGEIINARYDKWVKIIERSALESIWTAKLNIENKEKFLERFEAIRDTRSKKKSLKQWVDPETKKQIVVECITLQDEIKEGVKNDKRKRIQKTLEVVQDPNAF